MIRTATCLCALLGIAAVCPAPIIDHSPRPHSLPIMTPEQQAAGQRFNGTISQVGSTPSKKVEYGTAAEIPRSAKGAFNLEAASPEASRKATLNLMAAQRKLKLVRGNVDTSPWLILVVVLALVGGAMYGLKYYLDKFGPTPQKRPSEETSTQ